MTKAIDASMDEISRAAALADIMYGAIRAAMQRRARSRARPVRRTLRRCACCWA